MANLEQLAILKKGVTLWNKWRKENPNTWIDLSEASLPGANLSRANLQGADLRYANLSGANLDRATLIEGSMGVAVN